MSKALIAIAVAIGLVLFAVAFVRGGPPASMNCSDAEGQNLDYHPRGAVDHPIGKCLDTPIECGLVVW